MSNLGSGVQVRAATAHDAPAAAVLISELGYPTTSAAMSERLRAIAQHSHYATLVAVEDSRVLGFLGMTLALFYERDGLYARIVALSVSQDARNRGVGTALLFSAEEHARTHGAVMAVVNSGAQRTSAHRFYERLGYAATGKAFYKQLPVAR